MRVRYREPDLSVCPKHEAKYVSPSQLFFTSLKGYEVHAVSVYDGVVFMLVVDDLNTPCFRPRVLFDVVDTSVSGDWICNSFATGPIQLVLGPEFIAKDAVAYNAMIDQGVAQVERFWRRIDVLNGIHSSQKSEE